MRALAKLKKDARHLTMIEDPSSTSEGFFFYKVESLTLYCLNFVAVSAEEDSDLLKPVA